MAENIDPVLLLELPLIRKIIADEAWLEGERRGCPVGANDPVVRENVCRVILRIGADMRERLLREALVHRGAGLGDLAQSADSCAA